MYKTVECSPPGAAPAFRMPAARSHSWSMVVMIKQHLKQNVYEAFLERLKFIFEEFDNIYISFSGGKDSGLLLNLVLDYRDRCFPQKALGVFHQDFEAQYLSLIHIYPKHIHPGRGAFCAPAVFAAGEMRLNGSKGRRRSVRLKKSTEYELYSLY